RRKAALQGGRQTMATRKSAKAAPQQQEREYEVEVSCLATVTRAESVTLTVTATSEEEATERALEVAEEDFDLDWSEDDEYDTERSEFDVLGVEPILTDEEEEARQQQEEADRLLATINKLREMGYTVAAPQNA